MRIILTSAVLAVALLQSVPALSQEYIAGLEPDRRPENAPVIAKFNQTDAWRAKALKGVTTPHPKNVTAFLKDQEAWFNPFQYPGMPGYYDIRGLHKTKP
jgi:hypothetical protein